MNLQSTNRLNEINMTGGFPFYSETLLNDAH